MEQGKTQEQPHPLDVTLQHLRNAEAACDRILAMIRAEQERTHAYYLAQVQQ